MAAQASVFFFSTLRFTCGAEGGGGLPALLPSMARVSFSGGGGGAGGMGGGSGGEGESVQGGGGGGGRGGEGWITMHCSARIPSTAPEATTWRGLGLGLGLG